MQEKLVKKQEVLFLEQNSELKIQNFNPHLIFSKGKIIQT